MSERDRRLTPQICAEALEVDGSLRDVYVLETTLEDWKKVLTTLADARYGALLNEEPLPTIIPEPRTLFAAQDRPLSLLSFHVGRVEMACHFFMEREIEFDFDPRGLAEPDLRDVLNFMERLGTLTGKPVVLTPENVQHAPIFRYEPSTGAVAYQVK